MTPESNDADMNAVGVITKVDEDKKLVFGWASIIKDVEGKVLLDRQDDFIDDEAELEKSAYSYVLHSRDGGEMHIRKGVSTMVESVVLTKEKQAALGIPEGAVPVGWWIGFRVNDDRVWSEVKKGGYVGFSVHGTGRRDVTSLDGIAYTEVEKRDYKTKARMNMAESGEAKSIKVSKRMLETLAKAKRAQMAALKMELEDEDDMDDMDIEDDDMMKMDCPKCGAPMTKGMKGAGICKRCGYLKKGDYPGHPFRGNQHTGGKRGGKAKAGAKAGTGSGVKTDSQRMEGGKKAWQTRGGERKVVGRTKAGLSADAPKGGKEFSLKVKGRDVGLKWGKSKKELGSNTANDVVESKTGKVYGSVVTRKPSKYVKETSYRAVGPKGTYLQGTFSSASEAALAIMRNAMK